MANDNDNHAPELSQLQGAAKHALGQLAGRADEAAGRARALATRLSLLAHELRDGGLTDRPDRIRKLIGEAVVAADDLGHLLNDARATVIGALRALL